MSQVLAHQHRPGLCRVDTLNEDREEDLLGDCLPSACEDVAGVLRPYSRVPDLDFMESCDTMAEDWLTADMEPREAPWWVG